MQYPLLKTESMWVAPEAFPDLSGDQEIAIDLETYDPDLKTKGSGWPTKNGHIIGVAAATKEGAWYFPMRHIGGGNMDPKRVLKWTADTLSDPRKTYVFHNAMYDVGWLGAEGIEVKGKIVDTMVAAPLLDEHRWSYALNALGKDYLQDKKDEELLKNAAKEWGVDPKAEMYKLPPQYVGPYAEQDAALTLKLWDLFKGLIVKEELSDIFELELKVLKHIIAMRRRGVRIDMKKLDESRSLLLGHEKEIMDAIKREYGMSVDIWAAQSVSKVFNAAGLEYPVTGGTGAPSFTKEFLTNHEHHLPKMIVKARELNKARTTFIETIDKHQTNGRIHADIHQLRQEDGGTITGRFSYSNPNLQQIPSRDEFIGPMIRSLFLPEEGCQWGAFDYSSQEPRIVVHYADILGLKGASDFVSQYRENPRSDFHQIAADIVGVPRKQAKAINLGLFYGMGINKLAAELGLELSVAKELFARYHEEVPFVKQLTEAVSGAASKRGAIRTLLGRKCRYDKWEPASFGTHKSLPHKEAYAEYGPNIKRAYTYKALNALIQGSAADQTKSALVMLAEEGILPMIQIHDELALPIPDEATARKAKEIMETCVELRIPSIVDAEIGPSWGQATEKMD